MDIDLGKTQAQIDWLKQKLFLDANSKNAAKRKVKRGQVYSCELGVGVGSELQKKRPCVILQNDIGNIKSSVTTIIPITHTHKALSCFRAIIPKYDNNGTLILDGYVNVSGIRSIDKARIGDYICDLTSSELKD
ncbi:MAG: type II toxin-antitoxin system PemK/MazF family toxin, partial [Oscillospiraceae bacterium]|nr:type II toxin-antitoxin system PemK/MazF family toxin [Oscillospiraceae bacterium]